MVNVLNKEVEIIVFDINSQTLRNMEKQKTFPDLNEVFNYLDERQISKSSEDESDIDISHQSCEKVYIQPLLGDKIDVDSGNEEDPTINNLCGDQLLAPASLKIEQLGKSKKLSITNQMLANNNKSESPSLSSSSSGENHDPKQKRRQYEKKESTYPSKDTENPSKRKLKKEYINS